MDTPWPEKFWTNRERVIGELVRGKEFTTQLQILLQEKPFPDHASVSSAEELVEKILRSFTETLSVLSSCDSDEVFQIPVTAQVGSPSSGDRRSEDSGETSKMPALKDRRGGYKRRKTSESWMIVSHTMEDNYAWRKYGQKEILNAKYPRCYFRCTHKKDQGCGALKQVQRIKEDPNMYQTTYFGHHTCRDILKAPQMIISDSDPVEPYPLSFKSKTTPSEQDHHDDEDHPLTTIEKFTEETQSTTDDLSSDNNLLSLDSILWPDLMAMESSGAAMMMSPRNGSDHDHDVISSFYSCVSTSTSHGLDMDILIRPVDFDNDFHFDEI